MTKYEPNLNLVFSALSDPTRRAVIARLARGPATVSELAASHAMALPSFLGHLGKLERAGLIRSTKSGRVRSCALTGAGLAPAQDWLSRQRALWETRLDQFDDYVTGLMKERDDGSRSDD
ncbi:winged helix-turn-helix transcriptional regulator [Limibaculum sp. M0105]|uniref:Winged helix-turn-helix transcriptional regulator n=2 Tax=Thermohalobaculum xanthum TaxID=2753746 RepID=A0A8J7SBJ8_9RHOB|nr:winged helix-turn-helix transcriptional regulator [Thermohalobaculum xanthum]